VASLEDRFVEVIARRADGTYGYGSGCVVAGVWVLTAAHVVDGPPPTRELFVRRPRDGRLLPATRHPDLVGRRDGSLPDLALVEVAALRDEALPALPLAEVDRATEAADPAVERVQVVGFPKFMERVRDGQQIRDSAHLTDGRIPVLSLVKTGLLSVEVGKTPRELPPREEALGGSPWSGISGAPIVADGLLLGVVSEHAPREGSSTLTGVPLALLEKDDRYPGWGSGVSNPGAWWSRLGAEGRGALTKLPRPLGAIASSATAADASTPRGTVGDRPVRGDGTRWDFYVSAATADTDLGGWITSELERQGYLVRFDAWDVQSGNSQIGALDEGTRLSTRTIVVLSRAYPDSADVHNAWTAAFSGDRLGKRRNLIPVRVDDHEPPGVLGTIKPIDLRGMDDEEARRHLVEQIRRAVDGFYRPATPPPFPRRS
jgi:hypothetical protein